MILSMTGYASYERNTLNGVLLVELRSVNHRYLELQLKLDDNCRMFEALSRELLNTKLGRGKIDCRISLVQDVAVSSIIKLNHTILRQIAESANEAAQYFPHPQPVNLLDVLRMPGVIASNALNGELLEEDVKNVLNHAIEDLIAARAREGEKLKAMILQRLTEIEKLTVKVKPMLPELAKIYQDKLLTKLNDAHQTNDDERIRQEIVLYAQRIDVDEELSRLSAHIDEVKRILNVAGLVGKRLDFLMQEMNREANTLGSKSVAIETTQISMELKVLIEQMREQIQNIE
ncbi:MAG: YicC/YloC family endoribonuclease [Methylophilaceae bacterium]